MDPVSVHIQMDLAFFFPIKIIAGISNGRRTQEGGENRPTDSTPHLDVIHSGGTILGARAIWMCPFTQSIFGRPSSARHTQPDSTKRWWYSIRYNARFASPSLACMIFVLRLKHRAQSDTSKHLRTATERHVTKWKEYKKKKKKKTKRCIAFARLASRIDANPMGFLFQF